MRTVAADSAPVPVVSDLMKREIKYGGNQGSRDKAEMTLAANDACALESVNISPPFVGDEVTRLKLNF